MVSSTDQPAELEEQTAGKIVESDSAFLIHSRVDGFIHDEGKVHRHDRDHFLGRCDRAPINDNTGNQ